MLLGEVGEVGAALDLLLEVLGLIFGVDEDVAGFARAMVLLRWRVNSGDRKPPWGIGPNPSVVR